jgi:hypothetical protein
MPELAEFLPIPAPACKAAANRSKKAGYVGSTG